MDIAVHKADIDGEDIVDAALLVLAAADGAGKRRET